MMGGSLALTYKDGMVITTGRTILNAQTVVVVLIILFTFFSELSFARPSGLLKRWPSFDLNLLVEDETLMLSLLSRMKDYRDYASKSDKSLAAYKIVKSDMAVLTQILRSEGYYENTIKYTLLENSKSQTVSLRYDIAQGDQYTIQNIYFDYPPNVSEPVYREILLKPGDPLIAQNVLTAKESLIENLSTSCLFEVDLSYRVILYQSKKTVDITFTLKDSPKAHYGKISFSGEQHTKPEFLAKKLKIKEGGCFSQKQLNASRMALLQTNLLSSANPIPDESVFKGPPPQEEIQSVDIHFKVVERHYRTVKAGGGYSTDGGPGGRLGWENRNFFGGGERLKVDIKANKLHQYLEAEYIIPYFFSDKQKLIIESNYRGDDTEAYISDSIDVYGIVSRTFGKRITAEVGVGFIHSNVVVFNEEVGVAEGKIKETYNLVLLPLEATYNKRDSILDATTGWSVTTSLTPYADIKKDSVRFLRGSISGTAFFSAKSWPMSPTLAMRIATGSIAGTKLINVPADERFYSGGGGSVRGYAYQYAGEFKGGVPIGGLSMGELSVEARLKVAENWGLVVFADGGYSYPDEMPNFGQDFLWGAGLGLRYLTSFAPFRFDVGVPLDRREYLDSSTGEMKYIDDSFQFYISIGQAF